MGDERFRADLVDAIDGIVWEATAAFEFTFVSRQAERLLGYPVARWTDEPTFWVDHVHPDDRDRCIAFSKDQTAQCSSHQFEYRMLAADGRVVWLRDHVHVVAERGLPVRLGGIMVDVTDLKQTQAELEQTVSILQATLEAADDGLLVVDLGGRISAHNRKLVEMWGLPPDVLATRDCERVLSFVRTRIAEPDAFVEALRRLDARSEAEASDVVKTHDGRFVAWRSRPQKLGAAVVGRLLSFCDVTERTRSEDELRESEERYRSLYTSAPVMMHSIDREGRLVSVTNAWLEVLGYERAEVIGRRSVDFLTPESRRFAIASVLPEFFQTGVNTQVPYQLVKKDGDTLDVLLSAIAERDAEGRILRSLAVLIDVTERNRAQRERDRLFAQENAARSAAEHALALMDTLLMNAPVGLGFVDTDFRYIRVNDVLAAMHGVHPTRDVGRTIREAIPQLAPKVEPILRRVLETAEPTTGLEITGEVPGFPGEPRSLLASYYPVRTTIGGIVGVGVVVLDVTEQKRAEEARARLYGEAQEAIRVRDDFMLLASHELKTPLTPLLMNLQLLDRRLRGDAANADLVSKALRQVDRLRLLINNLLDTSRIEGGRLVLRREPVSLRDVVREQVASIREAVPQRQLDLDETGDALMVDGDAARLAQVVANLIDNALRYSPNGDVIHVALARRDDEVRLSIRDPGIGIPEEQQRAVFERYFRARNVPVSHYGGLGLGLYISRDIIERHGGRIWVESEVGRGSTFFIALPRLSERG